MKLSCTFLILGIFFGACAHQRSATPRAIAAALDEPKLCNRFKNFTVVLHAGLGGSVSEEFSTRVLGRAADMALAGATSLDLVEFVIRALEDDGHFNAGKGAITTTSDTIELDASIMEGKSLRTGAVAGISKTKNPISAARMVMQKTRHVFLISNGAEKFAKAQGLEQVNPANYYRHLREPASEKQEKESYGTVGAVALDRCGDLAAGTSTGGWSGKMPGRVGDSPIVGASTYADNEYAALSTSGRGEDFIRLNVSYDVVARMKYQKLPLAQAMKKAIQRLDASGGVGGIIGIDGDGDFFTTGGIAGAYVQQDQKIVQY